VWLIRRGFGLNGWIYCTLYIHKIRDYRLNSAIAILHIFQFTHALGSWVFSSRTLVTEVSQSHCHFNSHMKSSWHSLIPFLPLFCNCQFRRTDSTALDYCSILRRSFWLCPSARNPRKTPSSVVNNVCYLAMNALLLRAHVAGICLSTRCLAMDIRVTISIYIPVLLKACTMNYITLVFGGNRLTPWGTLLLEKMIAPHLVNKILFLLRSFLLQSCFPLNMTVDIQVPRVKKNFLIIWVTVNF
jgi:hypothetical protein